MLFLIRTCTFGTAGQRFPFSDFAVTAIYSVGREKTKLYHPVKPLCFTVRGTIGRQCHRWLPSSVVQMLKKMRNTFSAQL